MEPLKGKEFKTEEKQLAKQDLSAEDIKTLTEVGVIPKDCSPELVKLYGRICHETQLNPFRKQIHFIRRGYSYTVQVGIDGYRSIADRTGLYAGSDDYTFEFKNPADKEPEKATATVYKIVHGVRCAFSASARMDEYKPQDVKMQFMWNKMPRLMLGKCAESLALRKAFPNELSGTYTNEEMDQADSIDITPGRANEDSYKKALAELDKIESEIRNTAKETNGKPAPTGNPFQKAVLGKCARCDKAITSERVLAKSAERFGKPLCFPNCQNAEEKERAEGKKDADFTETDFSEFNQEEVI